MTTITTINLGCNGVLFPMPLTQRQQLGVSELLEAGKADSVDDLTLVQESARVIQLPSIPRTKRTASDDGESS